MATLKHLMFRDIFALGLVLLGVMGVAAAAELITTAPVASGSTASGYSAGGQISGDGRFVLFQSTASDLTQQAVAGGVVNFYLADRQQGSVTLISKSAAGSGANAACVNASMSDDGNFVVFETAATKLVESDVDSVTDIYLRDVVAGTLTRISEPTLTNVAVRRVGSTNASISGNGQRVVFKSGSGDLVVPDAGSKIPLFFLYDRVAGTNRGIWSINLLSGYTTNMTFEPVISKSGTVVAFEATARDLITRGQTYGRHVYAYDLDTDTLQILSTNVMAILNRAANTAADHYLRGVSSNGEVVVFLSDVPSTSLASIRTNYLFRHVVAENQTELIATNVNWTSEGAGPFADVALSADGRFVAYGIKGNIYRWDANAKARELVTVATNGGPVTITNVSAPFMSADGRFIAFTSAASNLVVAPAFTMPQLYRRDMVTQTTVRISAEPGGIAGTSAQLYDGSISEDGKAIVFTSNDAELVGGDLNGGPDCLIWDETKTPRLSAVSKISNDFKAMKPYRFLSVSSQPMSSNGKIVAFSGQLDGAGTAPEIWLRDFTQGTTKLVSFEAGSASPGVGSSFNGMVSADGRWVAYETSASNIVSEVTDTNKTTDVILFDAQTGTNRFVTKAATGNNSVTAGGELRAMSANGQYLAVAAGAGALVDPPATIAVGSGTGIFLWDRESGAFRLVTRDATGAGVRGAHTNVLFSPDSLRMAFFAVGAVQYLDARTGQAAQAGTGGTTLLIHEVETGTTKGYLVSGLTNRVLAFSPDSTKLVTTALGSSTNQGVWRIDLATGAEESVEFDTGKAIAFESSNGGKSIALMMDRVATQSVELLDLERADTNFIATGGLKYPSRPEINADGTLVVFQNYANAPLFGDTNGYPNPVFYDVSARMLTPIANGNGASVGNILSADGSTLLVLSQASDLVAGDSNNGMDLFTVPIAVAPKVAVVVSGSSVDLRFPSTASDFVLESATALDGSAGSWQTVTANTTVDGDSIVVRISVSDLMRFFRLRK